MFKEIKHKIKLALQGEPKTDTYSMYSYKIVTVQNEEYKCNMGYYTVFGFKDWVDLHLLEDKSIMVANDKLISRETIKDVEFLKVMDSFNYTRTDSLSSFAGFLLGLEEAEKFRDKNDW